MPDSAAAGPIPQEVESLQAVLRAARFAAQKHAAHRRKGSAGEPYVNHLLEVAYLVSTALTAPDTNLVIAALLHDVVEDVDVTNAEVAAEFGDDVASLVAEVTDDKSLPKAERKHLQIVNAPKKTVRAQIIKLADKTSNLRAILHSPPVDWTTSRRREYCIWAKQVVDALSAPNPVLKARFDETYRQFLAEPE